jgi:hypothetical protein
MKLVYVEWLDSQGPTGSWRYLNDDKLGNQLSDLLCRSVGWLIHDGKDCKRIIPHLSGDVRGDLVIPSKVIVTMKELKLKR